MNLSKNEEEQLKKFLNENPKTNFLQSPEWAKVKTEWENEFIIVKNDNGEIKGTMSILLRKVPIFNRYIMYAPRGFVCDPHDKETLQKLFEEAKKIAKKYKAFIFKLDPDISVNDESFAQIVKELGIKTKKNIKNIKQVIQPKYVFRLNVKDKTEEELLKSFHEKTRYNIRLSARKGVTVREGKKEDLKTFYDIMLQTGKRDGFFIRPISYFERVYNEMGEEHVKILFAEFEGKQIATVMPILYGNKVWYLYGGSTNEHRNLMATYLMQWEMIKWAVNSKCEWYDFRGVSGFKDPKDPQYGVYKFKKGFNGDFIEFINEMYIVFNPIMNTIFNISEAIYKFVFKLKDKIQGKR